LRWERRFIETICSFRAMRIFVAIHDATVNRTTNGQGAVHDMKLAELRRLDAGSWFGSEFTENASPRWKRFWSSPKKMMWCSTWR